MRNNGATYTQIAKEFGISKQRVCKMLSNGNESYFKTITEKHCSFVGIREWLNKNKVSITEFIRRIYGVYHEERRKMMLGYLTKKHDVKKQMIDRILEITGLTYEQAFKEN